MPATTPPVFRLPRELRNRIYHFALLNARPDFKQSGVHLYVSYEQSEGEYESWEPRNLGWLLASRKVLTEGLEQYYRHATLEKCYAMSDDEEYDNILTLDGKMSIFELGKLRAARLDLLMGKAYEVRYGRYYDAIVPRGKEQFELVDEGFEALGKAIAGLKECDLKELELSVCLFRTWDHSSDWEASGNRFVVNLGGASGGENEGDAEGAEDVDEDKKIAEEALDEKLLLQRADPAALLDRECSGGDDPKGEDEDWSDVTSEEDEDEDEYDDSDLDSEDYYNERYWNVYGTNLSDPCTLNGYLIDFGFLKNLGKSWEKVKITYTPTYMERYWGDSDPLDANILAVPMIEESLAQTAKELVGGEGWAIRDSLIDKSELAALWVLDVERKGPAERTGSLEHLGLHSYLAPCEGCDTREEKFRREKAEDGMYRFVGEKCGRVVEFETPVFRD